MSKFKTRNKNRKAKRALREAAKLRQQTAQREATTKKEPKP